MFEQFLSAGIAIAGIDAGESFGSPNGKSLFTALHKHLTERRGFAQRPVLLGRSRGGLMALSWAADHPEKVAAFAGIYPVCNLASYPGLDKAAPAYELSPADLQSRLTKHNPVDRLAPLAKAGVPLFAIHGDVDTVVPLELNSGLVKERYTALGGHMQLIVPPGQGHNMWSGFFQSAELVAFVKENAAPSLTLDSPKDCQVVQRTRKTKGSILVTGRFVPAEKGSFIVEARLIVDGQAGQWQRLKTKHGQRSFKGKLDAPAGGWHRLEARARSGKNILAVSQVEHVGIGEVFVIAGQSNSANHGEEKQNTQTGLVSTFDGQRWRMANDPQPGASGGGGSFMPPFGDAIAERFHVPVGIVACGVGATSVREWLPRGATFPNPPTLTNNVRPLTNGEWESQGVIFNSFAARLKSLGPRGFRAVLWHQGESDANQSDPTRTLPGPVYTASLDKLMRAAAREIGWKAPWFVALASYHTPNDPGSPEIRAAQAALWKRGLAQEGPDTDSLQRDFRDSQGQGVHFSGAGLRRHAQLWSEKVAPWLESKLR